MLINYSPTNQLNPTKPLGPSLRPSVTHCACVQSSEPARHPTLVITEPSHHPLIPRHFRTAKIPAHRRLSPSSGGARLSPKSPEVDGRRSPVGRLKWKLLPSIAVFAQTRLVTCHLRANTVYYRPWDRRVSPGSATPPSRAVSVMDFRQSARSLLSRPRLAQFVRGR